ncbi:F-type H+-transporting ATPase subunit a [Mycoplasma testudineum]|uniref:F-type H+-transporting ATPase subunit a n=1 Tax=Mycoplasma testudineum TaxID=244584 RepID=A0A4V3C388_9MOLU|nr:F0F1 ATP synthase subunit A [Mycoplasma testudineum]OYD27127.1 F0F1 ATP synthase subunit A [Mycoplasma testudineum]TDO21119.1 F-type H+-transporting ATPase subunit a [Mycoplasma testudineum]
MELNKNNAVAGNPLTSQLWVVQPHILTLFIIIIIFIFISLYVFFRIRKADPKKAPKGVVFVAEQYVGFFKDTFDSATDGKINWTSPYLFVLFSFLLVGNLLALIGFRAIATAYTVPLTFALISWIMIYVFGIFYNKWGFFKKFLNPVEIVGQFIPILSLSIRMFGNITSGSVIIYLLYSVTAWIYSLMTGSTIATYVLGPIVAPLMHLYLDAFSAMVQAYVFTLLTMIYWIGEIGEAGPEKSKKVTKKNKRFVLKKA